MQDKELVNLYKQLYLKCKEYIKALHYNEGWPEDDGMDEFMEPIKNLEDKIDNVINDELTRLAQEAGDYRVEEKEDLYYK
jgi:hypothetical protein